MDNTEAEEPIAIIGMAGRFPGSNNIDEFWENLKNGVESITFFSDEELLAAGVEPELLNHPDYVKAKGALDDIEYFDAAFFGFTPKEAEITDPQQRFFLECAWTALENAGYDSNNYSGEIGVYGGVGGIDSYFLKNLFVNPEIMETVGEFKLLLSNDKDYVCTRTAYKLNLTGPAVTVQTACSTSLVAVVMACQNLWHYQCDMALAGGAAITMTRAGYLYQEGMIMSPDGHCRAFDANAKGIVDGNGVGIVVLKRLEDALADGDTIHAIIKGAFMNNDGIAKINYTAPSVEGQVRVIEEALAMANIDPETITYVEAHGTGTPLGDPIEIAALTQAFATERRNYCGIGSVKTNVGHLDTAAGVTNLIKATLALKHQLIPPSLHFESPNPKIDFANSPFYVNTQLSEWQTDGFPRRAGVSSFGIGGTNAHIVLEEAPSLEPTTESRPWQLLVLSAKTATALETATTQLVEHLKQHPDLNLADVAYTYQVGRSAFEHRRMLVCQTVEDVHSSLSVCPPLSQRGVRGDFKALTNITNPKKTPSVVFMFSGQGAQYVSMGLELYQTETIFREQVDYCAEFLKPHLNLDLRMVLYPDSSQKEEQQINQTALSQPTLFVIEYALAKLWMNWGIQPVAMIGHSIGEYVAACLAGVFTLDEALTLVVARGRLMQSMPSGTMLAVPLAEAEIQPLLNENIDLAAINVPSQSVISGSAEVVEQFATQLLAERGLECKRIQTSHAFHSEMMSPILPPFLQQVQKVRLQPPQIPYLSNVTGTWIKTKEATDPHYWVKHLRRTVRFAAGLQLLVTESKYILLEVGPGRTLSTFAKRHPDKVAGQAVLTSLRHLKDEYSDSDFLLNTLGQLWLAGVVVNWSDFYGEEQRQRLPLPTYSFDRQLYWVNSQKVNYPILQRKMENFDHSQLWLSLVKTAQKQVQQGISEYNNFTYHANQQSLEQLCIAYINLALRKLGAFSKAEQSYSFDAFCEQFHVLPNYQQLLSRWLQVLAEKHQFQQDGETFRNLLPISLESFNALIKEVKTRLVDEPNRLTLIQRCGEKLADVLTGKVEPLEIIFSGSSFDEQDGIVEEQIFYRHYNTLIQIIVQHISKTLAPTTNLRILEIGGGMGITTSWVLPILPPQQTNYTFTDVGTLFLSRAQQKFSAYPFVQYQLLNIEQSPREQEYDNHSFDVIIASNVLHVTRNMGETLEHVSSLLAPGGILINWEITRPLLDFDITDALLMQSFIDGKRNQGNPFLSKEQWQKTLQKHGFVKVAIFPETDITGHHILVAQRSESTLLQTSLAFTTVASKKDDQLVVHSQVELSQDYVAPKNKNEKVIVDIWQKFFGLEKIGIHDDFFELGGDSLTAVQLISQLRDTFQVNLASHHLIEAPTIIMLASLIEEMDLFRQQKDLSILVEIQRGNSSKFPLFCIHPAGGNILYYRNLARYFSSGQSIYGIQAPEIVEAQEYSNFAERATYYIDAIRTIQPKGPYLLAGMSYGGNMAYEMAIQLKKQGEEIALVAMLDSYPPGSYEYQFEDDTSFLIAFLMLVEVLLGKVCKIQNMSKDEIQHLEINEQWNYVLNRVNNLMPDMNRQDIIKLFKTWKIHHAELKHQILQFYPDPVIFFQATEPLPNKLGGLLNMKVDKEFVADEWREFSPELIHIKTPGNHFTLIEEPNVSTLANNLKAAIKKYFFSKSV